MKNSLHCLLPRHCKPTIHGRAAAKYQGDKPACIDSVRQSDALHVSPHVRELQSRCRHCGDYGGHCAHVEEILGSVSLRSQDDRYTCNNMSGSSYRTVRGLWAPTCPGEKRQGHRNVVQVFAQLRTSTLQVLLHRRCSELSCMEGTYVSSSRNPASHAHTSVRCQS